MKCYPLFLRRSRCIVEHVHRILQNECLPLDASSFAMQVSQYSMRNAPNIAIPRSNTVRYGQKSIRSNGADMWNKLPVEWKMSPKIELKRLLKEYVYVCSCGGCTTCSISQL
jgi:hypothetical protein